MSGTSADGMDAALVHFAPGSAGLRWTVEAFVSLPYERDDRARILRVVESGSPQDLCRLNADLGDWMADAVQVVSEKAKVEVTTLTAIGCHGHTVWHEPPEGTRLGSTLQLGDTARLAERTGVAVVSDFRSRDVAAGGHGAPLVPWSDQLLYTHASRNRALQNIGGMSNVTWLAAASSAPPVAFDTGPGTALIDLAAEMATDGRQRMDVDGVLAAKGSVNEPLLSRWMGHPFFQVPPPKSTGRETFGRTFLDTSLNLAEHRTSEEWFDLLATLTALTARSIAIAYQKFLVGHGIDEVFVTGGGARNPTLVAAIRAALSPLPVFSGNELGVDPEAREAVAFAALAWAYLNGIPANAPASTGADGPRVLGSFTPGAVG